jgi:hypothetical protein
VSRIDSGKVHLFWRPAVAREVPEGQASIRTRVDGVNCAARCREESVGPGRRSGAAYWLSHCFFRSMPALERSRPKTEPGGKEGHGDQAASGRAW